MLTSISIKPADPKESDEYPQYYQYDLLPS